MSLEDAIAEALANANPPPPNESTTCEWIIYPLLLAAGYARRDIVSRIADNNGQFPDYTILPDSPHAWFLEAKAWNVALEDRHAQQSLNYANQNGKRWVVLTNGREWRLYDNQIQGIASNKLVAQANLGVDVAFEAFLNALSKHGLNSDRLAAYARMSMLTTYLVGQFADENGDVLRSLWSLLRRQPGLNDVTRSEIASSICIRQGAESLQRREHADQPKLIQPTAPDTSNILNLDQLRDDAHRVVRGRQPERLYLPDGSDVSLPYWSEVAREVVTWVLAQGLLPSLPFQGGRKGKCFFLSSKPEHIETPMRNPITVVVNGRTVFVDVNRNGADLVSRLCEMCEEVGVSPTQFKVAVKATH
jgi:hypothetical protein